MVFNRRLFRGPALCAGWIVLAFLSAGSIAAPDVEPKTAEPYVRIETKNRPWENSNPGAVREFSRKEIDSTRMELALTRNKLLRTTIKEVKFNDTTVRDALRFLSRETGIAIVDLSDVVPGNEKAVQEKNAIERGDAQITLALKNQPAIEVLHEVAVLAGVREYIEPDAVIVKPTFCAIQSLTSEAFPAPREIEGRPIKEFLEAKGVAFPPGSTLSFDKSGTVMTVYNTPDNLDLIAEILEGYVSQPQHLERSLQKLLEWRRSLEKTVVLNAEIRDAPLEMVVKELRVKVSPSIGVSGESKARVSLAMKNTSVAELLRHVAAQTKTRLVIGREGIVFISYPEAKP